MTAHQWQKEANGVDIDEIAWDCDDYESAGGHNGPKCLVCGFDPCIYCVKQRKKDVYDPEQFPCAGTPPEGKEWYFHGAPEYDSTPDGTW